MQRIMRPSPGVTVLQYFLMSLAQALSSLTTLAVSFSRIVFPRSVCAETGACRQNGQQGQQSKLGQQFHCDFIERPLMTGSEPSSFVEVAAWSRWRLRDAFRSILIVPRKA